MSPTAAGDLPVSTNINSGRSSFREQCSHWALRVLPYGAAIALSCLLLVLVMELWKADLRIPF